MSGETQCLVVAGPSGVGKTTLIHGALASNTQWRFSVSATTRPKRSEEVDGLHYHFLTHDQFMQRIVAGGFLEYAEVYGSLYGTPGSELVQAAEEGKHLLIEVDTVGCLSIRSLRPQIPLLAVLPPSLAELRRRLRARGTETGEELARRDANIVAELQRMRSFDFSIVNDEVESATTQLLELMAVIGAGLHIVTPRVDMLLKEDGGNG